ncbi:hypothetical protein [Halobacteriovorax sp.]|uniref:COG1470 family protein n=1 Tax=Halobacteriovorax sp. TaxID=2020862 RepID=UPI003AF2BA44
MKSTNIFTLLVVLLFNTLILANSIEISALPDKTVQPGEVSIQVLPVRASSDTNYTIVTESNQQWRVEAPESAQLKAGELTYLTFYTYSPSFADAGTIHELKIIFIDEQTKEKIEKTISFVIAKKQDLDFFNADKNIETNKKVYTLNLKVKNTGNSAENYNFSVKNLTPEVGISLNTSPTRIENGETKLLPVRVNFKNNTSTYAAFEVVAKVGGIIKFQKKFQVKFVNNANNQDRQGNYLDTTLTITNDYMSVEGRDSNLSSVIINSNGALSDYVSLSSYIQANMVDGQATDARGTFHFDGDSWKFSAGNNVDLDIDADVGNEARDGIGFSKDILPNLKVGTLVGVNENDELNTAAMLQYDPIPGQRTFVILNRNSDTNETSGSIGYRGNFNSNDKLSFAPSLTVSDDPQRGIIQDYRSAMRYMVKKNLPIAVSTGFKKDRFQEVIYNSASMSYNFDGVLIELTRNDERERDLYETESSTTTFRNSNEIRVSFPLGDGLSASVNYQDHNSSDESESRKFITFAYQKNGLYAAMRAGVTDKEYKDNHFQNYTNEPFITINLSYKRPEFTISANLEYESFGDDSFRSRANIGINIPINNNHFNGDAYLRAGHDQGQRNDYVTQTETNLDYIEAGIRAGTNSNYSLEIYARAENNNYYDDVDYQVGLRFQYRFGAKTPRSVENIFGGKKTGSIRGRICIDLNNNDVCEYNEPGVAGLSVYSVTGSATTELDGSYLIEGQKADKDHISIIERHVTARSLKARSYLQHTKVRKNKTVEVNFPLKQISSLNVFSYNDINKNGQYDKDFDTIITDVSYMLIDQYSAIIPISGRTADATIYSRLRNGEYKLIATANSSVYEEVEKEVILNFPEDNMESIGVSFTLLKAQDLSTKEKIVTEFDTSILRGPKYEALLVLDSSETSYKNIKTVIIELNGYKAQVDIEEVFEGMWDIKLNLKELAELLKDKNKVIVTIILSNSDGDDIQIKRDRVLFYNK